MFGTWNVDSGRIPYKHPTLPLGLSLHIIYPDCNYTVVRYVEHTILPYSSNRAFSQTIRGSPSASPSASPSGSPSVSPSAIPSASPSASPSGSPSASPTSEPSRSPSTYMEGVEATLKEQNLSPDQISHRLYCFHRNKCGIEPTIIVRASEEGDAPFNAGGCPKTPSQLMQNLFQNFKCK